MSVVREAIAPRLRVRQFAGQLVRAQRRQWLGSWIGLAGFTLAAFSVPAVLAYRLGWLGREALLGALAVLVFVLLVYLVHRWRARPSPLAVIIGADVRLNLGQRLSSAYEVERDGDEALAEVLARQAIRGRFGHRAGSVFPFGLSWWGRLIPAALALVVLVSVLDLEVAGIGDPRAGRGQEADRVVREEGERLFSYAQSLESRALTEGLTRAREAAIGLGRIGSAMRRNEVERSVALQRLVDAGARFTSEHQSLQGELETVFGAEARQADVGQMRALARSLDPGGLARRLQRAELDDVDLDRLAARAEDFARLGFSSEALERAIAQYREGDGDALERLLDELARRESLLGETDEIGRIGERVRRARVRLGDRRARRSSQTEIEPGPRSGEPAESELPEGEDLDNQMISDAAADAGVNAGELPGDGTRAVAGSEPRGSRPELQAGTVLRPRGDARGTITFIASTRAVPEANELSDAPEAVAARYRRQLEAVMAREDVPVHRKRLVRRYFLNLSGQEREPASMQREADDR